MKPIKLIISAFGPYPGQAPEIRFDRFEEKGLFLISGDTGAGKTTIFDAICYALYGKTGSSYRDLKNLRSEFADPDTESFVDFYFTHQGKEYHVRRTPAFARKKKSGSGTTMQKETAVFYEEGKPPVEGVKQVEAAVQDLLHLDMGQFKQVVMIAQGEFRDMLNAKTEQRTEILRTIFMTDSYKNIEFILKQRLDTCVRERLQTEQSIVQHFHDVTAMPGIQLEDELREMQEKAVSAGSAWNIDEFIDITDRIIAADETAAKLVRESLQALEAELDRYKADLATAKVNNDFIDKVLQLKKEQEQLLGEKEEIEQLRLTVSRQKKASHVIAPAYRSWTKRAEDNRQAEADIREAAEQLERLEAAAKEAALELESAEKGRPQAEELKKSAAKIAEEKDRYQKRDTLSGRLADLAEDEKKLRAEQREIEAKESDLKARIEEYRQVLSALKEVPEQLAAAAASERELKALQENLDKVLTGRAEAWKRHMAELKKRQDRFETVRDIYDLALAERVSAEKRYENSRAGLLARGLEEGEKCPVCGSTHHPEPAKLSEDSITEEELRSLREAEETLYSEKNEAITLVETERTALEETERILREQITACFANPLIGEDSGKDEDPDAAEPAEDVRALLDRARAQAESVGSRIRKAQEELRELEEQSRRSNAARESLDRAQGEETEQLRRRKETNDRNLQEVIVETAKAAAAMEELRDLSFSNWEDAEKKMQEDTARAEQLLEKIRQAEEHKKAADTNVARKNAQLQTLREALTRTAGEEQQLDRQLKALMQEHGFAGEEELKRFMTGEEVIARGEERINAYDSDLIRNAAQLSQAEKDAEGRERIDLQSLQEEKEEKEKATETVRAEETGIAGRIRQNTEKKSIIQKLEPKLAKARKDSTVLKNLHDLVRGQTRNGKITLEQYVQATGFDGIIRAANRRLLPMSDGQFELFRQEDSIGKKSNTFLDLEVLDNYTGHRRPVGNLSGGESFKASLSLALGLSDTVSSSMGGVQMDALFIDEGFGSLDRRSIDSAMDILLNLSNSNKLVGIISHREELKENIPQQIRVIKTRTGSTIQIDGGEEL